MLVDAVPPTDPSAAPSAPPMAAVAPPPMVAAAPPVFGPPPMGFVAPQPPAMGAAFVPAPPTMAVAAPNLSAVELKDWFKSAARGDAAGLSHLLASGLLSRGSVDMQDQFGWTALHIGCLRSHTAVVDLLLSHGANPNLPNRNYAAYPLHLASHSGA